MTKSHEEKFTPFYNGVFCQWYPSPMRIDGVTYSCAEQYMMAKKALLFGDVASHEKIMLADSPAEQKALGRKVIGFDVERWESVARDVVMRASLAKFTSSKKLYDQLMLTAGTILVEASPTDDIWGVCLHEMDPRVHDRALWQGRNWLGQVLTDLRESMMVEPSTCRYY